MKNKKKKNKDYSGVRCPYCGATTVFMPAERIYKQNYEDYTLLVCGNYPACDAYVKCHKGTRIPMGTPANAALRNKRRSAHELMDQLTETGVMSRDEIYYFLKKISLDGNCHVGSMGDYACDMAIRELNRIKTAAETIAARKAG